MQRAGERLSTPFAPSASPCSLDGAPFASKSPSPSSPLPPKILHRSQRSVGPITHELSTRQLPPQPI
eukprot:1824650-Pyramimonas_sp.AAC.2